MFRFDIDKRFHYGAEREGMPLFVVLHKFKASEIWQVSILKYTLNSPNKVLTVAQMIFRNVSASSFRNRMD